MQSIRYHNYAPLNPDTGEFNTTNLDPSLCGGNRSTISQFLHEIEIKCNNFGQIQKTEKIKKKLEQTTFVMIIGVLFFVVLNIVIQYTQTGTYSKQANWTKYMMIPLAAMVFILLLLRSFFQRKIIKCVRVNYQKNIENSVKTFEGFFYSYGVIVDCMMKYDFNLQIHFLSLETRGDYKRMAMETSDLDRN